MPGAFWALAIFIGGMSAIVGGVLMGFGYPMIGWPVVITGSISTAIIVAQGRRVGR